MATITNNSLPSIDGLINYLLNNSDDDSAFNKLASNSITNTEPQENQETPPKSPKKTDRLS